MRPELSKTKITVCGAVYRISEEVDDKICREVSSRLCYEVSHRNPWKDNTKIRPEADKRATQ